MHIGNFLKDVLKSQRYNMTQIAEKVNKSPTGVKKDLEKEKVTMEVLESYAKVLGINMYELLAREWSETHGTSQTGERIENEDYANTVGEARDAYEPKKRTCSNELSVTLKIEGEKKDKILKILMEEDK